MVRFLLLLILLLSPIRNSYAQTSNYCYCTYPNNDGRCYANTTCWACQPGAYSTEWQSIYCLGYQSTCQTETQTQTLSCPINQTGSITQTKTKTCTTSGQGIWGEWQTTSNTCVQNPPTCQVSSQQQTLACPTGYTGSITQTRSSTCPDPYGSPVWQPWVTTSNTCKKSIDNPTNPTSPISPVNTASASVTTQAANVASASTTPTSSTPAQITQSSLATAETPTTVSNSETTQTTTTSTETSSVPTQEKSATSAPAQGNAKETASPTTSTMSTSKVSPSQPAPKGKQQSAVGLVLSLELFQKPAFTQPNVFPDLNIVKGIPNEILMHDQNLMGLMFQPTIRQPNFEIPDLGFEQ